MEITQVNCEKPKKEEVIKVLKDYYSIKCIKLVELTGEVDFNFKVETDNNKIYLTKLSRLNADKSEIDFQLKLYNFLSKTDSTYDILSNNQSNQITTLYYDQDYRILRVFKWIDGSPLNHVNPLTKELFFSVGQSCGKLTNALIKFDEKVDFKEFDWDIAQVDWTKEYLHLFDSKKEKEIIINMLSKFEKVKKKYEKNRKSLIQNDANEGNIIVNQEFNLYSFPPSYHVSVIDFGDSIYTQTINDVAIGCAYMMMLNFDKLDSLTNFIKGYHSVFPLKEEEIELLYLLVNLRIIVSLTKSAINKHKEPENDYLLISEKPGLELLNYLNNFSETLFTEIIKFECGFKDAFKSKLMLANSILTKENLSLYQLISINNSNFDFEYIDLSIGSLFIGNYSKIKTLDSKIQRKMDKDNKKLLISNFGECQPFLYYYQNPIKQLSHYINDIGEYSCNLGTSFWINNNCDFTLHSMLNGKIIAINNELISASEIFYSHANKDYNLQGLLNNCASLEETYNSNLFTKFNVVVESVDSGVVIVYSSLHPIFDKNMSLNQAINKNQQIGKSVPNTKVINLVTVQIYECSIRGIEKINRCNSKHLKIFGKVFLNPCDYFIETRNMRLDQKNNCSNSDEYILEERNKYLGFNLSITSDFNKTPIQVERGIKEYLISNKGNIYLDTVNNVANVGHEHPEVVKSGQEQMSVLNTNTRYLHSNIVKLAKNLTKNLPENLNVVYFVNSGSEANELALRIARANSNSNEIITLEHGYHGNTQLCIDVSSYKFNSKSGEGCKPNIHLIDLPDSFKEFSKSLDSLSNEEEIELTKKYLNILKESIEKIKSNNKKVSAFIAESIVGCGGQVVLPKSYFSKVFEEVRNVGGVCIVDEVQTGFGRVGEYYWGFELYDVIPDIVTVGKPFGNGHPLGAVITTNELAKKFNNGMEYFNTFGGNPVSCAIGLAMMNVLAKENLQKNAKVVGDYLINKLNEIKNKCDLVFDIRGYGLFLGIEFNKISLLNGKVKKVPSPEVTNYISKRMLDLGILMSIDGPFHNVLKFKPPLCFSLENAKKFIFIFEKVLEEDYVKYIKS